jgi:hypothetical protein
LLYILSLSDKISLAFSIKVRFFSFRIKFKFTFRIAVEGSGRGQVSDTVGEFNESFTTVGQFYPAMSDAKRNGPSICDSYLRHSSPLSSLKWGIRDRKVEKGDSMNRVFENLVCDWSFDAS